MAKVEIYTKSWCPYSVLAKELLDQKAVNYEEIDVTSNSVRELEMINRSQRTSVPQIFVNGIHLGGSDDLVVAERDGNLDRLLCLPTAGEAA